MKLRIFALVSLLTLVSAAQASFELLLVGDNGANTTPTRRMHRFDGVTGTYLGAFGNFDSDIRAVVLRQAQNQVLIQTANRLFIHNYNTGELINDIGTATVTSMSINTTNNYLYYVNGGQNILRTSLAQLDLGFISPELVLTDSGATSISSIGVTGSGYLVTGQVRGGLGYEYKYSPTLVGSTSSYWSPGVVTNQVGVGPNGRVGQAITYSGRGYVERYDATGNYTGDSIALSLSTGIASAAGHVGDYLVGTDYNNAAL
ncbi:MAG: hypothetical protein K8R88_11715, partial [Armatimonadetes bacterium]|nr:hypothetical protein [Armatimonadota bacterium]